MKLRVLSQEICRGHEVITRNKDVDLAVAPIVRGMSNVGTIRSIVDIRCDHLSRKRSFVNQIVGERVREEIIQVARFDC